MGNLQLHNYFESFLLVLKNKGFPSHKDPLGWIRDILHSVSLIAFQTFIEAVGTGVPTQTTTFYPVCLDGGIHKKSVVGAVRVLNVLD